MALDRTRLGSLFTGIGAIDLAFQRAGFTTSWMVERDADCQQVLRRHFPTARRYRDVRQVTGESLGPVDILIGGFPCQDLSVAGRHAGLAGQRSGLWWDFHRLIAELAPTWVLIENVIGLLSSNDGRDLGTLLWSLGQLGYGWAYRVLDAQYFGVPQRRRRVFIVGCLGERAAAAQVLFEPERGDHDSAPRKDARAHIAGTLTTSTHRFHGDTSDNVIPWGAGVRRLTPREYVRLQGLPDDWTAVGLADTSRYHMLGNSVAVPVLEWIARRMSEVNDALP